MRKLYRSRTKNKFLGVCSGLGEYFRISPTIIRVLWVVISLFTFFTGFIFYFLCAFCIPLEPERTVVYETTYDEQLHDKQNKNN